MPEEENKTFNVDGEATPNNETPQQGAFSENPLNTGNGSNPEEIPPTPTATPVPAPQTETSTTSTEEPHPIPISPEPKTDDSSSQPNAIENSEEKKLEAQLESVTADTKPEDPKKIAKSKEIIVVIIAIILAGVLGYLGYAYFFSGGESADTKGSEEPSNTLMEEVEDIDKEEEEIKTEEPSEELQELDKIVNTLEDVYGEDAENEEVFEDAVLEDIEPEEEEEASSPPGFFIPEEETETEAKPESDSTKRIRR